VRTLAGSKLETPPGRDEIELSVFGPGFGESTVVHLGGDRWMIVDSCLSQGTKEPASLDYLEAIGVKISTNVRLVVSTHWHDDHIRGLAKVYAKCESAEFVCAGGLKSDQFTKLASLYSREFPAGGSGLEEFNGVLLTLVKRKQGQRFIAPKFVGEGTMIYETNLSPRAAVKALSPSSEAVLASLVKFSGLLPTEGQRRSAVPSVDPNDLAIVLTVKVGEARVLLGADLEERGEAGVGWKTVIERFSEIDNLHQGYKVSHHGSETGHHDGIWPKLLIRDAWAVLTPYLRGRHRLPTTADMARICALSPDAYITARGPTARYQHPDPTVRRQMKEMGVTILEEGSRQGHVRFRRNASEPNGDWSVEIFGDACQLEELRQSNGRRQP